MTPRGCTRGSPFQSSRGLGQFGTTRGTRCHELSTAMRSPLFACASSLLSAGAPAVCKQDRHKVTERSVTRTHGTSNPMLHLPSVVELRPKFEYLCRFRDGISLDI